ncbi:MAG TPA: hypothetical protein VF269_01180 [Rhodanobacteraceae bacterium]
MLRSPKLVGTMYIALGLSSAIVGGIVGKDALASVGVVFFCIGAAFLGQRANHTARHSEGS